jgi:hypothetical protein
MKYIDVFNGDADGICALIQLRLAEPRQAELVTGIKRDIQLLSQVQDGADSNITVLDISFEKNAKEAERLLTQGAHINYIDHHQTGDINQHPNLTTHIDLDANVCSSLIVDKLLNGQYRAWAITGAFGDNLLATATALAQQSGFTEQETASMKQLGTLLNFNGYSANIEDLFFHPAKLFEKLRDFETPFEFLVHDQTTFQTLADGYQQDMALAQKSPVLHETKNTAMIQLPDEAWANRVSGVFSNDLVYKYPDRAHAILTKKHDGSFLVSIRAPRNSNFGADELASRFSTGGGRKTAAGINDLPADMLDIFMTAFERQFSS